MLTFFSEYTEIPTQSSEIQSVYILTDLIFVHLVFVLSLTLVQLAMSAAVDQQFAKASNAFATELYQVRLLKLDVSSLTIIFCLIF